ncbi:MAG: hypothetical protein PF445_08540, partial [Melioribacteraceae bacterium]|nr:hypothetical protein [Melioribacteraceae bacterium]
LKRGEIKKGIELYELAISNARRINNDNLKNLAIVNFTRELILLNLPEKNKFIEIVKKMKINNLRKDLEFIRNDVLNNI